VKLPKEEEHRQAVYDAEITPQYELHVGRRIPGRGGRYVILWLDGKRYEGLLEEAAQEGSTGL
jgi:hypothetical protein